MAALWSFVVVFILTLIAAANGLDGNDEIGFDNWNDNGNGNETGHCIWYDVCGANPDKERTGSVNCFYNGSALPLEDPKGLMLLEEICPFLLHDPQVEFANGSPKLCCNTSQLKNLNDGLQVPIQLLGRCPACLSNFLR